MAYWKGREKENKWWETYEHTYIHTAKHNVEQM